MQFSHLVYPFSSENNANVTSNWLEESQKMPVVRDSSLNQLQAKTKSSRNLDLQYGDVVFIPEKGL